MQISNYTNINNSFEQKLVFHFGEKAGFYSEFNNMVLAIIYCLVNDIKFTIYSVDANFRTNKGWNDFFKPFCNESTNILNHFFNKRAHPRKIGRQKFYHQINKLFFHNLLITSDVWYEVRKLDSNLSDFDYERYFPKAKDLQSVCNEVVDMIYYFNDETQYEVDKIKSLVQFEGEYIGFHIRGGDKFLEHQLIEVTDYIQKAEAISEIRQGYVFTDDYSLFELMCKEFPSWTFQTLAPKEDTGYFHKQFIKLPVEVRKSKTIQMFASIDILSNAQHSFCTFSSNVGMFLGMKMGNRAHGVDFENWLIW